MAKWKWLEESGSGHRWLINTKGKEVACFVDEVDFSNDQVDEIVLALNAVEELLEIMKLQRKN